jgi:hypothetical protein
MKTQIVILKVAYNENETKKPNNWCWSDLIGCDNCIELINYGPEENEQEKISK